MILHLSQPLRQLLADLAVFFQGRRVEAYLSGGFLRDALLGRLARDLDLSIAADPLALGHELADSLGGHFFAIGQEQQMARLLLPDRGIHVDLLPLRGNVDDDLAGRDFTIDAMAASLTEAASDRATVIDPWGGRDDLRRRRLRVVSPEAFLHDPLRLLRGVRLCAELDFTLEPATADLIRRNAGSLSQAAPERRRDELMRILVIPRAAPALRLLDDLGLLHELLPDLDATRGVEQPKEHYWDVFNHLIEAVARLDLLLGEDEPRQAKDRALWCELWRQFSWLDIRSYFRQEVVPGHARAAVLKLGGLLHDIAKPQTKTFDKDGRMRFFGHAEQGADAVTAILRRLRFSAGEIEIVRTMIAQHLRPVQLGQKGPPSRRALYRYFRDCGDAATEVLFLSLADHLATVGPRVSIYGWRDHVSLINYMLSKRYEEETLLRPPRLVTGHDLMSELGLEPGPLVGRLLETVREAQAAGEVSSREEALLLARRERERLQIATA